MEAERVRERESRKEEVRQRRERWGWDCVSVWEGKGVQDVLEGEVVEVTEVQCVCGP